ncbi:hypothetical protein ACHAXN_004994 [Cyclotella atomus]
MSTRLLLLSLAIAIEYHAVTSFSNPRSIMARPSSQLSAAGMGMGTKPSSKGMGKKSKDKKGTSSFDVAKALIKSEKRYDELLAEFNKANAAADYEDDMIDIATEYIVAARCKPGSSPASAASDWIPVAQVCVVRPIHGEDNDDGELDLSVPTAVSFYCREIFHAACRASPSTFQSLPRNHVEYSVEPYHSFIKYVYDEVIEGKSSGGGSFEENGATVVMTKAKAREILMLDAGCKDLSVIKQSYKRLMFELHPDRFANEGNTQEERDAASNRFLAVKVAYETLASGGVRVTEANGQAKSWYASLGGKDRSEFYPIELMSMDKASALCNKAFKAAVAGVDPDVSMAFIARNQAAAKR